MAFAQLEDKISSAVSAAIGKEFKATVGPSVGGGCVSDTRVILCKDSGRVICLLVSFVFSTPCFD